MAVRREQRIQENLEKLEGQLKAWRTRVQARNRLAEGERTRREKVLSS